MGQSPAVMIRSCRLRRCAVVKCGVFMDFLDLIDAINKVADNSDGRRITGRDLRQLTPLPEGSGSWLPEVTAPDGSDQCDTVFVEPVPGSVVYCDLAVGFIEHSGIYIGNGRIVALERDGRIVERTPEGFMKGTPAFCIYVSCSGDHAVGSREAAERAREKIGSRRNYSFATDNCHHFSYGCLTGDFESQVVMLRQLKAECRETLGAESWCVWDHGNARERIRMKGAMLKAAGDLVQRLRNR